MKWLIGSMLLLGSCWTWSATPVVYVAKEQRVQYDRDLYLFEVLALALNAANYPANIEPIQVHPHQQRTLMMLAQGKVDVHWSMTSPERELLATAIKVPLFKGYIGKRVLLVNRDQLERFSHIRTLNDLKTLLAVQGHDWPDTKILAHNDLAVRPIAKYPAMFAMVAAHQADYFPRSFIEAASELQSFKQYPLAIVPNLYLSYPTAFYFFVNKGKPELAEALEKGLAIIQADGRFDALFERYFAQSLAALPLKEAIELPLQNPFFSD
ncbi:substrate-binding periplasmic protein [Pseudoalteromonas fenneropenaei]|uniref:Substrate-binding periplasmic protein n=1 Tax=Pseudoalteromonas fenneropenaei TaxID=1737459 RepID=A0ABV7CLY1_9GAMM